MHEISDIEYRQIELCVQQAISDKFLQLELIDHCSCSIVEKIDLGMTFEAALKISLHELSPSGIQEIEKEVQYVLKPNTPFTMKISMYFFGFVAASLLLSGFTFKMMHWPGATHLLFLASVSLLISMMAVLASTFIQRHYLTTLKKIRSISGSLGGLFFASGSLFKMMYWPGANIQILLGMLLIIGLFVPFLFWELYKSESGKISQTA